MPWSRFPRQTTSQLSCLGSTSGRQNSCRFSLPGRKLRRQLILYLWRKWADLSACHPYWYSLDGKHHHDNTTQEFLKGPAASMPAWLFRLPVLIGGEEWRLWHEWVTRPAGCPQLSFKQNPTPTTYLVWRVRVKWSSFLICCKSHWPQKI